MIIDVHGHYTTTPAGHQEFRDAQLAHIAGHGEAPLPARISDEQIRESVEENQLRIMAERGIDVMVFSPRAAGMEHHVSDPATAVAWARACNDLVCRVAEMFPTEFAPVAQLPQTPGGPIGPAVAELRRTVGELGFVGCNLNPDPSGAWAGPPMTDEHYYPLYDALVELDVPAMVHVSTACNPNFDTLGAHYLAADTAVFMQLFESDLFTRYPTLRLVIPHGGGAVPYHWGRYRGLAMRRGRGDPAELLRNVYFDTCVYHQPGIDLLARVVPVANILFASEMLGAVRGVDPDTGVAWDDTKVYVDAVGLDEADRRAVFELNARRVYPRLEQRLAMADDPASITTGAPERSADAPPG